MVKRTTINNGFRTWRYLFAPLSLLLLVNVIQELASNPWTIIGFALSTLGLWVSLTFRRIQFDPTNVYRVYGKRERVTPFINIVSIKRSKMKVNNRRLWKITYTDAAQEEKVFRFREGTFQHGSVQELIKQVQQVNPEVVVWQHPHFNHPTED